MNTEPDNRTDILLVAYAPAVGAIAELFAALARNLSDVARVSVLAPDDLELDAPQLVADIRFPYATRRPDRALIGSGWRAHRRAAALRPRAVLLFSQHPLNLVAAAHLRRSPLLFWWHEPASRGQVSRIRSAIYGLHDAAIAPMSDAIVVAAPSVDVPARFRAKTSVVPFPTMPEFARDSGRFAGAPTDILYFGKLGRYKGLDTLASALRILASRGVSPSTRLIGSGSLAETAPEMEQLIADSPGQVHHLDEYASSDDVGSALRSSRIVVFPYLTAAGSSTLAIAATHGTATIASRCGLFADFIVDGSSGLLVSPGNPRELADAIERLMTDDDLRTRVSAGISELATSTFHPHVVAEQLVMVVDRTIGST